jgi:hypothetical protein
MYQYLVFLQIAASLVDDVYVTCAPTAYVRLRHPSFRHQRKTGKRKMEERKHKKLTAQPHARAGSMEVDGYENPAAAEKQGFTSRGGSRTHALFRFTTRPRRISPQYR